VKLLTNNVLKNATITSTNESVNYPAEFLVDNFLRLRYQCIDSSDTITVVLDEAADIDSFYFGYTSSLSTISVAYKASGVTLGTSSFATYAGEQFASDHFATLSDIDTIVISITGTSGMYIGGIGAGEAIDMPYAIAAWSDEFVDNSIVTRTPHGQVQQNYVEPLKTFGFSFETVEFDDFYEIKAALQNLGGAPCWVTFFEDSPTTFEPLYCTVAMSGANRQLYTYNFDLDFLEAR
jgi:hypothetical protein